MNGTIISSKVNFASAPISVQVDGTQATAITPETTEFTPAENTTNHHAVFNYSAIVIPQAVAAGNFSISFKVNNTEYIWTATDAVTFESGKKHELHLLAGKDVVQGGAISAKPWGKETITEKETD